MVDRAIITMYSRPQMMGSGALPYFVGKQQQGGNWMQKIGKFAMPILKKFGLPIAKSVGQAALNTASDVFNNKQSFKEAIRNRANETLVDVKDNTLKALKESLCSGEQEGSGLRRKRKRLPNVTINKKRKFAGTIFAK